MTGTVLLSTTTGDLTVPTESKPNTRGKHRETPTSRELSKGNLAGAMLRAVSTQYTSEHTR